MTDKIKAYLSKLEEEKDIKILLACETGSRAWGFPSPDSDYDVRIIYVHKKDWYLKLKEEKDTIELMLDDNLVDITGWDIRKTLRLLYKSNPALLERLQSPIVYQSDEKVVEQLLELAKTSYSRISTLHHYLSLAKKCFADVEDAPSYKLKRFFYALRATIACYWILEKDEMPPIEFKKMLANLSIPANLLKRINELIELKATINETDFHQGEENLKQYMKQILYQAEEKATSLPAGRGDLDTFNTTFLQILEQYDHR